MGIIDLIFPCMKDSSLLTNVMALYSIMPILFFVLAVVIVFVKRRTSWILIVLYYLISFLICEIIIKNIVRQPRPKESCNTSYGMPSAHSSISVGLVVWFYLEILFISEYEKFLKTERTQKFLLCCVLLLPATYSRIYLYYHTVLQVIVGSCIGAVLSIAWFIFLYKVVSQRNWLTKFSELSFARKLNIVNNYRIIPDKDQDIV